MSKSNLFFDSSALIAGIVSDEGAARVLLLLSEDEKILLTVSEQVIVEVERNLARKAPRALPIAREMIVRARIRILHDPPFEELLTRKDWIKHQADLPILVAAAPARVDYFVTLNRRHFIEDAAVAQRSGLRIGSPDDVLAWVRHRLAQTSST